MKKHVDRLSSSEVDYNPIIKMVWQQFQSGHSIFLRNGGLSFWTKRTILSESEVDSFLLGLPNYKNVTYEDSKIK
ncbi:MAG: hypothetical protein ACK5RG_09570 [Cyclobacteriaceae bacterium]|jgi:hypothetical protein|nr:hypothetical protein [Flammeovirgaceae bacterium]